MFYPPYYFYTIFSEYQCGDGISEDCQAEYDNPVNNENMDYFYKRCATEEGPNPLRSRCSLCCNGNNDYHDILRTCAGPNAETNFCDSSDTEEQNMCVCNSELCNDVCNGCDSNEFKCYQCSPQDSWCNNIDEVLDHGDEAQKLCSSKKCLISGK